MLSVPLNVPVSTIKGLTDDVTVTCRASLGPITIGSGVGVGAAVGPGVGVGDGVGVAADAVVAVGVLVALGVAVGVPVGVGVAVATPAAGALVGDAVVAGAAVGLGAGVGVETATDPPPPMEAMFPEFTTATKSVVPMRRTRPIAMTAFRWSRTCGQWSPRSQAVTPVSTPLIPSSFLSIFL